MVMMGMRFPFLVVDIASRGAAPAVGTALREARKYGYIFLLHSRISETKLQIQRSAVTKMGYQKSWAGARTRPGAPFLNFALFAKFRVGML